LETEAFMEENEPLGLTMLIAERHRAVLESLVHVISELGGAQVTGKAGTAAEALGLASKLSPDIAIIDLELSPGCSLISALHESRPDMRIIVMADQLKDDGAVLVKALEAGAVGAIYKQSSLEELAKAVSRSSRITPIVSEDAAGLLLGSYLDALVEKRHRDRSTIEALAAALEVRDLDTGKHVHRVTELAGACLEKIDPGLGTNEEMAFGFMLHDVGKIGVPDSILNKPGPLSSSEWDLMRQHPEMGVRIVEPLGFPAITTEIILAHHERWDGSGYPRGLSGTKIPVAARAFAVVDAFDAMTNSRPYKEAWSIGTALGEIRRESGRQFDPEAVDAFERIIDLDEPQQHPAPPITRMASQ
jgi:putative two-component system response regulator